MLLRFGFKFWLAIFTLSMLSGCNPKSTSISKSKSGIDDNEAEHLAIEKALVVERALKDRTWMKNPDLLSTLTEKEIASRLNIALILTSKVWKKTLFFVVTDPTEKPGSASIVVAVTADRKTYRIASVNDLQRLILYSDIRAKSADKALQIAKQYIMILGTRYPQYGDKIRILISCQEIPLRPGETLPEELCNQVQPPIVEERDDQFEIRCFTWTELGGELKSFDFQISTEGEIAVEEILLGEGLGTAWLPK